MKQLVLGAVLAAMASPAVAGELDGFVLGSDVDTARMRLAQFGSVAATIGTDGEGNALQFLSAKEYDLEICKGQVRAIIKRLPADAREWTRAVGTEMGRGNPLVSTINDDEQTISAITLSWRQLDSEELELYMISSSGRIISVGRRLHLTGNC